MLIVLTNYIMYLSINRINYCICAILPNKTTTTMIFLSSFDFEAGINRME